MAGGGVGEAMLIGAAMGAGTGAVTSAIDKKDPLQGALMGAVGGAAMGGIGSALGSGATTAAQGVTQGATQELSKDALQSGIQSTLAQNAGQSATSNLMAGVPTASAPGMTPTVGEMMRQSAQTVGAGGGINPSTLLGPSGTNIPGIGSSGAGITGGGATGGGATGGGQSVAQWMSGGKGAGFAPNLTNAQAYGSGLTGGIAGIASAQNLPTTEPFPTEEDSSSLSYFKYDPRKYKVDTPVPQVYQARYADGGIASLGAGSPIQNPIYPQSQQQQTAFASSPQMPNSMRSAMAADYDARTNPTTSAELPMGYAGGGISDLGGYSDGGRLLKGPGDGVSDSIPASIGGRQPARLADGEFVVPSRIVSELGNGSTDAGARRLYDMMDRVQARRSKTMGKGKVAKNTKAYEALPA